MNDKNIRGFYLREPGPQGQKGFPIAYVASLKENENIRFAVCTLSNKDRGAEKYQRTATRDRAIGRLLSANCEKVRIVPVGPDVKLRIVQQIVKGDVFGPENKPLYPKQTIKAAKSWLKAREEHARQ